jgi:hypothetical protein
MARATVSGYCWPQSAEAGERVALHLASSGAAPVTIEVARIGEHRTVVVRAPDVPVDDHPVPEDASANGCGWPAAFEITVADEWASGYYEVTLTATVDGRELRSCAFFVVRPAVGQPKAPMLLVLGTNTWHAYNDFGGRNLYNGGVQSSLQRPMGQGFLGKPDGAGQRVAATHTGDRFATAHVGYLILNGLSEWSGSAGWPNWELPFVRWAEHEGYAFDVASSADLEDPARLSGYRLMLSVGHDEYWSGPARDTVEGFIASGGNVAFLSGNTSFWQVRLEDDGATMVGYKQRFEQDPRYETDQSQLTSLWSDRLVGRPENSMTGVSFARGGYARIGRRVPNGAGGYTIHRPGHWLFEGTDLEYGDLLGAAATVVGYECDGCDFTYRDGLPYPTGMDGTPDSFQILGTAPAASFDRATSLRPPGPDELSELEFHSWRVLGSHDDATCARLANGHAVLGTYTRGGTVVTSGCTDWVWGLAERDAQIEQITRNIFDRLAQ